MKYFLILIGVMTASSAYTQEIHQFPENSGKISLGVNTGIGASYTDKAFLMNVPTSLNLNLKIYDKYFVQFAPKYTWLIRWNEHYLTLPFHFGINANKRFSFFAGPALTYDIGYFKAWGISAGAACRINNKSSILLSSYTFNLYDYHIDYFFVPVGISYNYRILK